VKRPEFQGQKEKPLVAKYKCKNAKNVNIEFKQASILNQLDGNEDYTEQVMRGTSMESFKLKKTVNVFSDSTLKLPPLTSRVTTQ